MEDTIILICFFVLGILVALVTAFLGGFHSTEEEKEHFSYGVLFLIGFIMAFAAGISLFSPKTVYLDKFETKEENISEYRIDTTFTTTNGITDTTYTLYYNYKK